MKALQESTREFTMLSSSTNHGRGFGMVYQALSMLLLSPAIIKWSCKSKNDEYTFKEI